MTRAWASKLSADSRRVTRAWASKLSADSRRDLEMILIGMAFAGDQALREQIASEILPATSQKTSISIASADTNSIIAAIAAKRSKAVFEWLAGRGVLIDRGLPVRQAIANRLKQDSQLTAARSLCKQLTFSESMTLDEIGRVAELILQAAPRSVEKPEHIAQSQAEEPAAHHEQ